MDKYKAHPTVGKNFAKVGDAKNLLAGQGMKMMTIAMSDVQYMALHANAFLDCFGDVIVASDGRLFTSDGRHVLASMHRSEEESVVVSWDVSTGESGPGMTVRPPVRALATFPDSLEVLVGGLGVVQRWSLGRSWENTPPLMECWWTSPSPC